ncbi:AMP-binding protein [Nonomuraea soli]|uniref:Non-ribosomal peptide synthetase component E (Peptide arylation enzyme) n=1 Tax=Nonomuraea soli TaxID=1032476 RepID=A0A7W0CMP6_9ACTN|nr:AMP-binding protein [Nonomuraea soli]MBA2893955.1 non-ribosomal peptide synthetase component E (peptide arylation enzyme) [Nonomuraea soli]
MPTWTDAVLGEAGRRNGRPAVTDAGTGEILTYELLPKRLNRAAAGLRERGLSTGDPVLVHLPPGANYPLAVHAAAAAGGLVVPLEADMDTELFYERLCSSRARILITDAELASWSTSAVGESRIRQIFAFGEVHGATAFCDLDGAPERVPVASAASFDGRRVVSHAEMVAELRRISRELRLRERDVVLVAATESREQAMIFDVALMAGAHIVATADTSLSRCRELIGQYGVTLAAVPPRIAPVLPGTHTSLTVHGHTMIVVRPG